ncbi:hypothetical protein [Aeromonas veronii]|uniref:hypothetical protein n=1 Tax=Aeromonas veronii TaxID=654 RepID=UPI001CD7E72E|nr:hypothetical protein [Aeromonas veronii]MCF5889548.1 hypothetical protein [Aeromonas veronii]UBR44614.1 hypothetical protein LAG74_16085 [Aeromonas veronii]
MREIVKKTLEQWIEKFESQQRQDVSMQVYDHYLDLHLLGVAKFLKDVSFSLDDIDLLGISTKLEIYLEKKLEEEYQADMGYMLDTQKDHEFREKVRKICIEHFYTNPKFVVDMSKYQVEVGKYAANFSDSKKLSNLLKYIDEKNVLDKIYQSVKNKLSYDFLSKDILPEYKDVELEFNTQLKNTYCRADEHVYKTLQRYAIM